MPYQKGTDAAFWSSEIVGALAASFTRRSGIIMSGFVLLAIAEERRKRGEWFKVGRKGAGSGFGDLDDAANM